MADFSIQYAKFCFVRAGQVLSMDSVLETAIFKKHADIVLLHCFK